MKENPDNDVIKASGLERFAIGSSEFEHFQAEFSQISESVSLSQVPQSGTIPASSGCYFWIMRFGAGRYKIYVGRTRSLRRRLKDYCNQFQVHSPNDYKLRFFQEFMATAFPASTLELYFKAVPEAECVQEETRLVREYRPLINLQGKPTEEERQIIQDAFRQYYASVTRRALKRD